MCEGVLELASQVGGLDCGIPFGAICGLRVHLPTLLQGLVNETTRWLVERPAWPARLVEAGEVTDLPLRRDLRWHLNAVHNVSAFLSAFDRIILLGSEPRRLLQLDLGLFRRPPRLVLGRSLGWQEASSA